MKLYELVKTRQHLEEVKPLYSEFKRNKEEGTLISFEEVTREQLLQLWFYEGISDSILSDLFNVKKTAVTYRRREVFKLTDRSIVTEELLSAGVISKTEADLLMLP